MILLNFVALPPPGRGWFEWSGWIATILGTTLACGQLIYAAIQVQRIKVKNRSQGFNVEPGQIHSSKARVVFSGLSIWPPVIRALFWITLYQPLLGGAAAILVLGDAPHSGPYIPPVLSHDVLYQVNAVGLILMLIIGGMWARGAWQFYKRLRDSNRGWFIVPIAGALASGGFALIIAVYTKLGLDWISMLYTYRVVDYVEILQKSHSRLHAIATLLFTWNGLSFSYAWFWVTLISWIIVLSKIGRKLTQTNR